MHFDPVASQDSSGLRNPRTDPDDDIEREADPDEEEELEAPRAREGLPASFRMRHGRHYVEQLMGDAPLRTVRELEVTDIDEPPEETQDLEELERSIRELGVLEPLLVARHGRRYRVISGTRRLRAAARAGLHSVPCLVHEVDDETLNRMKLASAPPATVAPVPEPLQTNEPGAAPPALAFNEVTRALTFVSNLLPVIPGPDHDRLRWSVLTDLAGIELMRARSMATAAEVLSSTPALDRRETRVGELMDGVVGAVAPEARMRGVRLDLSIAEPDYRIPLDMRLVKTALIGLAQGMLALTPAEGAVLRLVAHGTVIRPALIVEISREDVSLGDAAARGLCDGDWHEHPAGRSGAVVFAGGVRVARLHGGRVGVSTLPRGGCTVTFVVPRPLDA